MPVPEKNKWKRFERLIAAIESATSKAATVTWNEVIGGRQFDVVIRFTDGPHSYVTLIGLKHPVAVEKIDAFATKARDANANKAVIISSAGFQSDCIEVAMAARKTQTVIGLYEEKLRIGLRPWQKRSTPFLAAR